MADIDSSLSLSNPNATGSSNWQKAGLALFALGMLFFFLACLNQLGAKQPLMMFLLSFGFIITGSIVYIVDTFQRKSKGIHNDHIMFNPLSARGSWGWMLGIFLTGFYIVLYWFPQYIESLTRTMDPLSQLIRGEKADHWFLYGWLYTLAILIMGVRAIMKYRHSNYHIVRTSVIMFVQLGFAFLLPAFLRLMNQPEFYFSYFWPLDYDILFPSQISYLRSQPGGFGIFILFWAAVGTFIGTPILTYFFGKRWYCSWVCGCGGLANTAGDQFRHLSDKSLKAWQFERWSVHSVLVIIVGLTAALWYNSYSEGAIFGAASQKVSQWYGFYIGMIWAGVIGVGFYPLMGTRVWCRFGCPMAAYLGLLQKYFSRFRITTNGGQCISCGNCSTYCEMGIDVRAYAQRGENIVRASCVGCGMCSTVCPRGVLNLENGKSHKNKFQNPIEIGEDGARLKV